MMAPRLRTLPSRLGALEPRVRPAAKVSDPHYQTAEHRAWAAAVIQRAGGQCQALDCQTIDRGRGQRLFADHIVELKDGGAPTAMGNGQALCGRCHGRKTAAEQARRLARPT